MSLTQEHPSPPEVVEPARRVLGGFDLDPASCAAFNETIRATRFIGKPNDGLAVEWHGRVWLNPPGGTFTPKRKKKTDPKLTITPEDAAHKLHFGTDSRAAAWWYKLIGEYQAGRVTGAVFCGFTLEILRTTQHGKWPSAYRFPVCIPRERLCFDGDQPTHANAIIYLGPDVELFMREFSTVGECKP